MVLPTTVALPSPKPLTAGQLNLRNTFMAVIQASVATLGLFLPTTKKKAVLVNVYTVMVANSHTPGTLSVPQPPLLTTLQMVHQQVLNKYRTAITTT